MLNLLLLLTSLVAHAGTSFDLCADGAIEGSYSGKMNGRTPIRANVICVSEKKMVISIGMTLNDDVPIVHGFTYVRVDGDRLIATDFSLDEEDHNDLLYARRFAHLSFDLPALRAGRLEGRLLTGQLKTPQTLSARRDQTFPRLAAAPTPVAKRDFEGDYQTRSAEGALSLRADVLLNMPLFAMTLENGHVTHFAFTTPWTNDGLFRGTSSVNEGYLTHIRGRYVPNVGLEFFIVDPRKGLRGPYLARRLTEAS